MLPKEHQLVVMAIQKNDTADNGQRWMGWESRLDLCSCDADVLGVLVCEVRGGCVGVRVCVTRVFM